MTYDVTLRPVREGLVFASVLFFLTCIRPAVGLLLILLCALYSLLRLRIARVRWREQTLLLVIHRFDTGMSVAAALRRRWPALQADAILGFSQGSHAFTLGKLVPLDVFHRYAVDAYRSVVYDVVVKEDEERKWTLVAPQHLLRLYPGSEVVPFDHLGEPSARGRFRLALLQNGHAVIRAPDDCIRNVRKLWQMILDEISVLPKDKMFQRCIALETNAGPKYYGARAGTLSHNYMFQVLAVGEAAIKDLPFSRALHDLAQLVWKDMHALAAVSFSILMEPLAVPDTWREFLPFYDPNQPYLQSRCACNVHILTSALFPASASAPHIDGSIVTVLPRASCPGLEVFDPRGRWMPIEDELTDNDIIVQGGMFLSWLTNGFYRPQFHRVVCELLVLVSLSSAPKRASTTAEMPRTSMPFFFVAGADTLRGLTTTASGLGAARNPPVQVGMLTAYSSTVDEGTKPQGPIERLLRWLRDLRVNRKGLSPLMA